MLDKFAVARALREIGLLLEIQGENPFKVRAYATGARALEDALPDLPALVASGQLQELRGIGEALAKKIVDLHTTGHTPLLDRLRAELPAGLLELAGLPELGPRKIAALHAALGIDSAAALEAACRAGRVREVKGFGPKAEAKLLEALARRAAQPPRLLLSDALDLGAKLTAWLSEVPGSRAELAGSTRRWRETVGDVDVLASAPDPEALVARLAAHPAVEAVVAREPGHLAARMLGGAPVDLRAVAPAAHAAALALCTGGEGHRARLLTRARERGYALGPEGLVPLAGGPPVALADEAALYARLGLPWIPPELREDQGELEAAEAGTLPDDLVRPEDVRGLVHCHTRWSDGRATLEEMARAADALGMDYLTVTDHSPSAGYAGGLTLDRLQAQWEEIARVQERVKVRLLRGTEADITEDGALDYPDHVLERLEVVVASVHQRHRQDEEAMTRRLVRAMRLPFFKIWGHALGRLLLEREPFACRVEEVLDALAASRGAVEVNGDPRRLELEPRHLRAARARGVPVVLSVDAHSVAALGHLRFAVGMARRGWVRRGEVLNTLTANEFAAAVRPAG